jgi:hypothetical protein
VDQVTIALNGAGHTLTEARGAVEGVLNGLHGEVSVAAINHLEERDLRVSRQVHILGTVCNKLHQTTTRHFCLYPLWRKKFWQNREKIPNWSLPGRRFFEEYPQTSAGLNK